MKKINLLITYLVIGTCCCLIACKKTGNHADTNNTELKTEISYQLNGKTYDGSEGTHSFNYDGTSITGIVIDRPDLFGGKIIFNAPDCAYLVPEGKSIVEAADCMLSYDGVNPIDSSAVYLYQSGILNSTTSNCSEKIIHDPFTGENDTYHLCDIKGNFTLTLINNTGDTIEIKNGSFSGNFLF